MAWYCMTPHCCAMSRKRDISVYYHSPKIALNFFKNHFNSIRLDSCIFAGIVFFETYQAAIKNVQRKLPALTCDILRYTNSTPALFAAMIILVVFYCNIVSFQSISIILIARGTKEGLFIRISGHVTMHFENHLLFTNFLFHEINFPQETIT